MTQIDLTKYKPIPNCSRYLISEDGKVWDTQTCKHVSQMNNNGYMTVNINYGTRRVLEKVHRLVYRVYIAEVLPGVRLYHKDKDRTNNHYSNIGVQGKDLDSQKSKSTYMELLLYPVNTFKSPRDTARSIWYGIMARCYDTTNANYARYGGKGVIVCEEWKTQETFIKWYAENNIIGWAIDKDILSEDNLVYSPSTCVFIPRGLNSIIAKVGSPEVVKMASGYSLSTFISCGHNTFYGDEEEDCLEQLALVRKLQLEKMLWLMKGYVSKIPNSPQIDLRVIQKIKEMID